MTAPDSGTKAPPQERSEDESAISAAPLQPQPALKPSLPEKPGIEGLEEKWAERWAKDATYRFDRTADRSQVYSIDTPPPTVSGSLHIGHAFSYTHPDTIARYSRMRGYKVFYPMGWDDNGLPTERRVQQYFGVKCDPSLPADPNFTPPEPVGQEVRTEELKPVSRPDFLTLCHLLTETDEKAFEEVWTRLGLSVDWSLLYTTISDRARRTSQKGFLQLLASGDAYSQESPTLWDVDFQSAISQAELEDREMGSAYNRIRFSRVVDGEPTDQYIDIETTRPELIPACVALVCHPEDDRYAPLVGSHVATPLFKVEVPILAHPLAEPDKGSGIAMICTFGDLTDVLWWRELQLPTRTVVGRDGKLRPVDWTEPGWESLDPQAAATAYSRLEGRKVTGARKLIIDMLGESGDLIGDPKAIKHAVKFYEKGNNPLEIVSSRQWYVRTMRMRPRLIERGRELEWHPPYMVQRYESWVEGLNGDWNISRQRFFGVPFPVWYPVASDGSIQYDDPIVASENRLPVDPATDLPEGFTADQRGVPGGFVGDPDVMDTWATSSLTPQIAGGWVDDPQMFEQVFPMNLRPQSHEIIRTWLFSTVVRADLEHGTKPWNDVLISGWVLDPDRKKMSKSIGNVVTPMEPLKEHGSDAIRHWAASARPGIDAAVDQGQFKVGRRLAIKVLNASRFCLSVLGDEEPPDPGEISQPVDLALIDRLRALTQEATTAFDNLDYARSLERTEGFFWSFCDDYLELVKNRAYADDSVAAS
ncbi:MAG: valine--tRNA ligase, partial [Acidimicrobiales bacterium]